MNSLILYHLLSGQAFFSGTFLIVAAAAMTLLSKRKGLAVSLCLIGVILVVVSGTPFSMVVYGLAAVLMLVWFTGVRSKKWNRIFAVSLAFIWTCMAIYEFTYQFPPKLKPVTKRSIAIVGDSVTAGLDDGTVTWPKLLRKEHLIVIEDFSHAGETTEYALQSIKDQRIDSPVIILEIGGNDLLGSTSAEKFDGDLRRLLAYVTASDRQVLMFELPLPPFCNSYGTIQRGLADEYGVVLIPKHMFLSVLLAEESTLDSIHLSQAGQNRMANVVWGVLKTAFGDTKY